VNVATRIRVAWDELARRLPSTQPPIDGLRELRNWMLTSAREVAAPARAYVDASRAIARFVDAEPTELPAQRCSWEQLLADLATPALPHDPVQFARTIERHAAALAVYTIVDSACRTCQADLEIWWHPVTREEVHECNLIGCRWTPSEQPWGGDPHGLVPATRAQITAWRGDEDLIPLRSSP
jgi:hypothetical protein